MYKAIKKYYKERGDSKVSHYFIVMYKKVTTFGNKWEPVEEIKTIPSGDTYRDIKEFNTLDEAKEYLKKISTDVLPPDEEIEIEL